MSAKINVMLPKWIFDRAQNMEERNAWIDDYMKRYPGYRIIRINGELAVCVDERFTVR